MKIKRVSKPVMILIIMLPSILMMSVAAISVVISQVYEVFAVLGVFFVMSGYVAYKIESSLSQMLDAVNEEKAKNESVEREVVDAEAFTKLMLDSSPLSCQIWDKDLNTVDCNEAAVKLYGFKNKQEYVERFLTCCNPEFQPDGRHSGEKAVAFVKEAFKTGYAKFDWIHKMPDYGTLIPAEITLVRVEYKGEYMLTGYTRDLRSIKAMEKAAAEAAQEAQKSALAKVRAEAASEALMSSIRYASKIQRNLLPEESAFKAAFSDYSIIWEPRDIVGGDIYWLKNFYEGSVLCVCDCTGHGTPGALLTMLVASALDATVNADNCHDTAEIMWQLEQWLVNSLNVNTDGGASNKADIQDGCDLVILFIAKDGSVSFSSGNTSVFVCDGKKSSRIKGQKIYIGEGKLNGKNEVETRYIAANSDNKLYIASDGLFTQPGGESGKPFGYKAFEQIILENHDKELNIISAAAYDTFEKHRGAEPKVDDLMLISIKP